MDIKKRIVTGVQVVPVDARSADVVMQLAGPDQHTTGWGVYTRGEDGLVEWMIDSPTEDGAMMIGTTLADSHGVKIELQPWKEKA